MDLDLGDPQVLIWGTIFGIIGMSYFIYGKKRPHGMSMLSGIGLTILPYLTENLWIMIGGGVALMVAPFYIEF